MRKVLTGVTTITLLVLMVLSSEGIVSANSTVDEPVSDYHHAHQDHPRGTDSYLLDFIAGVYTGSPQQISGIYIDKDFALPVVQQPVDQAGFISLEEETVTEFQLAKEYGSIGLLAHNYLAGEKFFQLGTGETIHLVYGNGTVENFTIMDIDQYQALSPYSPNSQFLNLEIDNELLSAADLFYRIYDQDDALILQTCIEREGNESWGRLFIVAVPEEYTADMSAVN